MGTDVHVMLGRVNKKEQDTAVIESTATEIALLGNLKVAFGDIELQECDRGITPDRCYALFGWLADITGDVKPMVDSETLYDQTDKFLRWIESEYEKANPNRHHTGSDYLYDFGMMNLGGYFYPVKALVEYDYDQVCMKRIGFGDDYGPDPEGCTYRQRFNKSWFAFLDYLVKEKWDFVVFNFG